MRRARVVVEPRGQHEIATHAEWIESQGAPQGAAHWLDAIESAVASLGSYPERCAVAPESEVIGRELRQLVVGSHRVIFAIEGGVVHVLYVRHSARRPLGLDDGD